MRSTFEAFTSVHFDPVFSNTAIAPWAEYARHVDVESFARKARTAIHDVASAAQHNHDPSLRIALIEADAGFGKTHTVITTLGQLAHEGRAYPVVAQLSVKLPPEEISLWLLRTIIDELSKSYFQDADGRTPLKRLAHGLLQFAQPSTRQAYLNAVEEGDDSDVLARARTAAPQIRTALADKGITSAHEPIIAGLLLAAEDASYPFANWLRGGKREVSFANQPLPPLATEAERHAVLSAIAALAHATGAPLILVFDQIEAVAYAADSQLLGRVVVGMTQLVEHGIRGTGVIFAALGDTFSQLKQKDLPSSTISRLENGTRPVQISAPATDQLRAFIDRRAHYLLELSGSAPDPEAGQRMAPDWLIRREGRPVLRQLFQVVRDYRTACRSAGKLLSEREYTAATPSPDTPATPPEPADDFDKLWADEIDADVGSAANLSGPEKADLFDWLIDNLAEELPEGLSVSKERITLEGAQQPTTVFDIRFQGGDDAIHERWKVALIDAPNAHGQLRDQIETFLDRATNSMPALLRIGPKLPRMREDGMPQRSIEHVRGANGTPQAGPPLANLLDAGGRIAHASQNDWIRLRLVRKFVEERRDAPGFADWRRQRRFLLEAAGIGWMTKLVQPVRWPDNQPPAPRGPNGEHRPDAEPPASAPATDAPPRDVDPRVRADILLGHALETGEAVSWCLDRNSEPALPNFGLMVSGDAGQGKTQAIKAIISEIAALDCPILIFDFKNDYGGDFAARYGFQTVDLNDGLPFNPLCLPPHGASGAQAINHVFELGGLFGATLGLGDRQRALLRQALEACYEALGVPMREWVDPQDTPAPALGEVIEKAQELDARAAEGISDRLGLLHGKRLLPSSAQARMSLNDLLAGRFILAFHTLPNDEQLKRTLAELVLIQLQGHMLRGDQPRALRRLLVFDEAWRAANSKRLIEIAREGRAFGVGVIAGSQFADDLSGELTGNLATKLHLYNSDASKRRRLVQALLGSATGAEAAALSQTLGGLKPFEAVLSNQQHAPHAALRITPHFEREPAASDAQQALASAC